MKLLLLSCAIFFASIFSILAQPQPTHYVVKIAANPMLPLLNTDEGFNYYDNNGHLYQTKSNTWNGSTWELSSREYYTLNAAGAPTQILKKIWDAASSALIDNYRQTFGYHTDGQQNYLKEEFWNVNTNMWEIEGITTTTFTPNNKQQVVTREYYVDGIPTYGDRTTYAYDGADRVLEIISETAYLNVWTNYKKENFVYNGPDEDYDESFTRTWDELTNDWYDVSQRNTQTVTNAQRVILTEVWNGVSWDPNYRNTTNYNANGQDSEFFEEVWDNVTSVWILDYKYEFFYNNDQSIFQFRFYFRDFDTEVFYLYAVVDYDYGTYAVSTQAPALQARVSISPNPTADIVRVEVDGGGISKITLSDLHGKVLAQTTANSNTATLSLAGQPAGAYFLRVEQGGAVKVLPVVKR